jgi:hypothetical protein
MKLVTAFMCLFAALSLCAQTAAAFTPDGQQLVVTIKGLDEPGLVGVNRFTGAQEPITSGGFLQNPTDVVVDGAQAIVADADAGGLITVNLFTGEQSFLAVDGDSCWIYVKADVLFGAGPSGVSKIDPRTGASTLITPVNGTLQDPIDIIMGKSTWAGQLLVADPVAGGVFSIDPESGEANALNRTPMDLCWLEIVGDELYATSSDGLFVFNPTTSEFDLILEPNAGDTFNALARGLDGHLNLINIGANGADGVYDVDPATRTMRPVSEGGLVVGPTGVAAVAIPEPGSLVLLGLAAVAPILLLRRSSQVTQALGDH